MVKAGKRTDALPEAEPIPPVDVPDSVNFPVAGGPGKNTTEYLTFWAGLLTQAAAFITSADWRVQAACVLAAAWIGGKYMDSRAATKSVPVEGP